MEQGKKNIIWSFAGKIINILLPFVTQTCLIYILGVQYVGLNGLFTSVLTMLSLTELGIGSALVFSMYRPIAEGNDAKVCALLAFYRKCYHIIGCVILTAGLILLPFIRHLISGDVPDNINVYVLYAIYLFNTVLSYFLFAYKTSLLNACQMVDVISRIDIFVNIIKCILQLSGLLLVSSYYVFVWVIPLTTVIRNLCVEIWTRRKYPHYRCQGKLLLSDIHQIAEKVKGLFFFSISGIVVTSADNIVVSACLGLVILGKYNSYFYICNALIGLMDIVSAAVIPVIGNSIVVEDKEKNYRNFVQFNLLWQCLLSWCAISLLCLQQPFIELWAGKDVLLREDVAILFAVYFYSRKTGTMIWTYKSAGGIWKEGRYVPLISAMVNLVLNLILVNYIGLRGVLLSTIMAMLLISVPFGGKVLFDVYFNYDHAWKNYMFSQVKMFLLTLLMGTVTYSICKMFPLQGFVCLLVRGIICLIIPSLLLWLCYHNDPRLKGMGLLLQRVIHKNT